MELIKVKIDKIKPYERNARKNDEAVKAVVESIKQCEYVAPIVVDEDYVILCGHTRLKALKQLGYTEVEICVKSGLTDEQKRKYRLLDNKTNEIAEWDFDLLAEELDGLDFGDLQLDWGVGDDEPTADEIVEDEVPEVDEENPPICQLGDVWQLGEHMLMCGDSTDILQVETLMNGNKADLVLTDPPYNVDYTGGTDEHLKIENDNQTSEQFAIFLEKAFNNISACTRQGGAYYCFCIDHYISHFIRAVNNAQMAHRQTLIWVKNALVLGHLDYQKKHEPILYGWKDGGSHYFVDDRTQTTVYEDKGLEFKKMRKDELVKLLEDITADKRSTTVLHEDKPVRNADHPTMKPVRLIARLIKNSTRIGETVLDTFGGSGSTLIACEQLNRKCYTMELDPKYCDVIIKRWETLTGQKAVKI